LWLLAACGDGSVTFKGSDISGTKLGQNWSLVGMDGKTYTPASFQGKVTLVFLVLPNVLMCVRPPWLSSHK